MKIPKTKNSRNNLTEYIKGSHKKILKERKEFHISGDILVYVNEPLPENVDLDYVIKKIETNIPNHLMSGVDVIYVGQIEDFAERDVNAKYADGAIYITNIQDDNDDMVDDIVHELAHSVEETALQNIYADGTLEEEFLGKRKRLFDILSHEGYNIPREVFLTTEYSRSFDEYLYKYLGYPLLQNLTMGLFNTAYGVTSIREYFATGFEEYFLGDRTYLRKISPQLYLKLESLSEEEF